MQLSHAVLLAGGVGKNLHPLTSAGTPKALLSVGNQGLISFPLRTLEQGGVTHTVVVSRFDCEYQRSEPMLIEASHN